MSDLMAKKEYAEIYEYKDFKEQNENCIRVYMSQSPDVFTFQIRTFKPITGWHRKGKPRNMIASVSLTLTEMEQIIVYMAELTEGKPRINTKPLDLITPSDES